MHDCVHMCKQPCMTCSCLHICEQPCMTCNLKCHNARLADAHHKYVLSKHAVTSNSCALWRNTYKVCCRGQCSISGDTPAR